MNNLKSLALADRRYLHGFTILGYGTSCNLNTLSDQLVGNGAVRQRFVVVFRIDDLPDQCLDRGGGTFATTVSIDRTAKEIFEFEQATAAQQVFLRGDAGDG
ncbi:hypothetical protein D3C84_928520 [compost metagenome]